MCPLIAIHLFIYFNTCLFGILHYHRLDECILTCDPTNVLHSNENEIIVNDDEYK